MGGLNRYAVNIAKILEKCPKFTKLYSPLFGEVDFLNVDHKHSYPIRVRTIWGTAGFSVQGTYYKEYPGAECLLFPSKNQRDWSKFVTPRKDLEIGTPCVCFIRHTTLSSNSINIRYYAGNNNCYTDGEKSGLRTDWNYIIPVDKFSFKDLTFDDEDNYGTAYKN